MRYCSWEGREFPDADFELVAQQYVHKEVVPQHNTMGELVGGESGIPEADLPLPAPDDF
jgi:hypothetical protein